MSPLLKEAYQFANITTKTTTVVKSGAGTLYAIIINTKGAGSNTCVAYDNATGSGTTIASIDPTVQPGTLFYNCQFQDGLTIITATGTQADITVVYR